MKKPNEINTGFTLIELLIVVAIIAILAAIAIPNFLAAQTRAKVARVNAEMRTIATGLETYYVDNSVYVPADEVVWLPPGGNYSRQLYRLSTPIAYLTSIPLDRFSGYWVLLYPNTTPEGRPYQYYSDCVEIFNAADPGGQNKSLGAGHWYPPDPPGGGGIWPGQKGNHKWVTISFGPSLQPFWILQGVSVWPYEAYDPTNGVTSFGMINRFGP